MPRLSPRATSRYGNALLLNISSCVARVLHAVTTAWLHSQYKIPHTLNSLLTHVSHQLHNGMMQRDYSSLATFYFHFIFHSLNPPLINYYCRLVINFSNYRENELFIKRNKLSSW